MNEMVERVARALCVNNYNNPNLPLDHHKTSFNFMWQAYVSDAKAAIEAMRQPTDQQRNNYYELAKGEGYSNVGACFYDAVWERSIDGVLKDE